MIADISAGSIMWNLLINGSIDDFCAPPTFDDGQNLVGGQSYTNEKVDKQLLIGAERHWVAARYSHQIRNLVRQCLRYQPTERPSLEDLREGIAATIANPPVSTTPAADEVSRLVLVLDRNMERYAVGQYCGHLKRKRERDRESDLGGGKRARKKTGSPP